MYEKEKETIKSDKFISEYVEYLRDLKEIVPNGTYIVSCPNYYYNASLKDSMVSLIKDELDKVDI